MTPLLSARSLTKQFGGRNGCRNVSFDLYPGEVLCIVGESGSGKTTLLNTLALKTEADSGSLHYTATHGEKLDLRGLSEPRRRLLMRTEWGFVQQNPRDGLRSGVSAGANIGEPLMAVGARHYGDIRHTATRWMERVELDATRIDELPAAFPAACSSACRSRAISSPGRVSSSWTSRPPASIRRRPTNLSN